MGLFDLFAKKEERKSIVSTDMHSHLIPGVDDGSTSMEESIAMIQSLIEIGYTNFFTTPHIMGDFYKNSPENLIPLRDLVRAELKSKNIACTFNVAAEYYIDEWFFERVKNKEALLTMGNGYLLVETSYLNRPNNFYEVIFALQTQGYKVILAHPERYTYMYNNFKGYQDIFDRGVYFQLNLNSLTGYYSPKAKSIAEKLVKKGMVHFIGTDCHTPKHIDVLQRAINSKTYKKLSELPLLNDTL